MPSRRYDTRNNFFVALPADLGGFNYAWLSSIKEADGTAIGCKKVDPAADGLMVYGANRPKPPKVRHEEKGSSFCAPSAYASPPSGWRRAVPSVLPPAPAPKRKSRLVWINHDGMKFCWCIALEVLGKIGDSTGTLGIEVLSGNDKAALGVNKIIGGASLRQKPFRAKKTVEASGDEQPTNTITTYCASDKVDDAFADGWDIF